MTAALCLIPVLLILAFVVPPLLGWVMDEKQRQTKLPTNRK